MYAAPVRRISFYSLFAAFFAVFLAMATPCHAIIDGRDAAVTVGQVQMWVDQTYRCTGSLIAPGWVLTARHCVTLYNASASNTVILLGDLRLGQGEAHTITGGVLNTVDDIALLHLAQPTNQVNLVAPWGLVDPPYSSTTEVGAWGQTATGQPASTLQTANFNVSAFTPGAPTPAPENGPIADYVSLVSFSSKLTFGDSGAGVFSNGLVCAVVSGGDPGNFSSFAVKTQAVAEWIIGTSGVVPSGICTKLDPQKRMRVMALGDQITQGTADIQNAGNSYRSILLKNVTAAEMQMDLVGSRHSGDDPAASGWEGGSELDISAVEDDAKCAIFNYAPDIVTLEAGTQDMVSGSIGGGAEVRMESLIDTIQHVSPRTTVLIAPVPPSPDPAVESQIESFNAILKNRVITRQTAGQHVDLADPGTVTVSDTYLDRKIDIYLNANGYLKLAAAFSFTVVKAVNKGWIFPQLSLHSDLCKTPGSSGGGGGIVTRSVPEQTFNVNAGGASFTTAIPANSVATYTWTDGGPVTEWLTSADGGELYNQLASGPAGGAPGANASSTITVDPGKTYQTIDGFGGAMTDSAASLIAGSPNHDSILRALFGNGDGQAGLTMVRSPMGSSDLMADPSDFHTYEDTPGSFSVTAYASDQRQINVLQQAKTIAGSNFKLLGTPWSAPGWMKRGGSLRPAQCGTDQDEFDVKHVGDYAAYFANYVNAYAAVGLTPWMVSMGNEPENCKTQMPTTLLSSTDELLLASALKGKLPDGVKVLGWDHNWNDEDYVNTLTSQGVVDAIGYHCYDGTHYGNQTQAVPTYMTECSGFTDQSGNVAANLGFEVANLLIGPLRNGSRGSLYWTLAQDPNGNPHLGGTDACQNCRGMITVNADGSFQPSQDFYFWAQFSKFIPPGSVRIDSSNSGDLSTVAFRNGNSTTLVVLNSSTHADGGAPGSDERNLRGHIVQWDGDTAQQKTAWLVGADGYRRWIGDGSTYNCLKYDAGMQGPDLEASGALDKYINLKDVWAVCGTTVMGTRSELEVGTYLKSPGGARLTLTKDGMSSVDSSGNARWAPPTQSQGLGSASLTGDRFILQEDQNLILYSGLTPIWASNTVNSGAIWLAIHDDGTFALFNKANQKVWGSEIDTRSYRGKMVQWDGDTSSQKSTWMVGNDGNRRWVPDMATFQCLHDAGAGNSLNVSSDVLDKLPNLDNVWATCGGAQLGTNGALEQGSFLKSGNATLTLTSSDLVVAVNGIKQWSTGHGGAELKLQTDGNLVEYDANGSPTWASHTNYSDTPAGSSFWLILYDTGTLFLSGNGPDGKNIFSLDLEHQDIGS